MKSTSLPHVLDYTHDLSELAGRVSAYNTLPGAMPHLPAQDSAPPVWPRLLALPAVNAGALLRHQGNAAKGEFRIGSYLEPAFKLVLIVLCISGLLYVNSRSERTFSIVTPPPQKDVVEETLIDLQAPKERVPSLSRWIKSASGVTHVDPMLLVCLLHTESRFRNDAVSRKGYRGEAQTKRFSEFSSVNILEGAEILRNKLSLSRGDMLEALARYKGGKDKKEAREQAREVLRLYQTQLERRGLWSQR